MEILIGAVLIGLIPAAIAQKKGYNFFMWWLFGAALFIVALPVSLIMSPDPKAMEERKKGEGYRKCPKCAEWIKEEAIVCKHCGYNASSSNSVGAYEDEIRQLYEDYKSGRISSEEEYLRRKAALSKR